MQRVQIRIRPRTAFGSSLRGDTLFGQLAWAIRHRFGEERLGDLLQGYGEGYPFLVISDAFPADYLPRPSLPMAFYAAVDGDHKALKRRSWLPRSALSRPIDQWLGAFVSAGNLPNGGVPTVYVQSHNSIDRRSGTTTSEEGFAPYEHSQWWYDTALEVTLDLYAVFDPSRISAGDVQILLEDVGAFGYGRDATTGLGKFSVEHVAPWEVSDPEPSTSYWCLAPCAPQGGGWDADRSFYVPFTRFGKHGDLGVHTRNLFKNPILMADTGAILTPKNWETRLFVGSGLGGNGEISLGMRETVQQGYAPVLSIALGKAAEELS